MVCSPVLSGNKMAVSVTTLSIFDAAKDFEECDKEILVVTTPESETVQLWPCSMHGDTNLPIFV